MGTTGIFKDFWVLLCWYLHFTIVHRWLGFLVTAPSPAFFKMSAEENTTENVTGINRIIQTLREECEVVINASKENLTEPYCRGVFDGWACWSDTPNGTVALAPCPEFIVGFDPGRLAHKECQPNGTWFMHPETQKTWSNYTSCVDYEDLSIRQTVNQIYEVGYLISLIALVASLAIFSYFKSLRNSRTTLHIHLFVSFAVNNGLWIIWYRFIIQPEVTEQNAVLCRVVHVILHYFLVSNYCWMLCEGLYLHTMLVNAFLREDVLLKWMYVLGWGLPALAIIVYASLRAHGSEEDTQHCWMSESSYKNVLIVPVCASMVLNLIFLCNIVRVLMIKLRAGPRIGAAQRPSQNMLQALRATLLLVPLLGLHYLLTPFRPEKNHSWEFFYEVLSATTAGLQGLCVATLFCFCNGEVISQMKRRYQFTMFRNRANSCTATTVSFVRSTAPTTGEENV